MFNLSFFSGVLFEARKCSEKIWLVGGWCSLSRLFLVQPPKRVPLFEMQIPSREASMA